jgi:hypothetical protein
VNESESGWEGAPSDAEISHSMLTCGFIPHTTNISCPIDSVIGGRSDDLADCPVVLPLP